MELYHISHNQDIKYLEPRIPCNYMTKNGYEDGVTARVCISESIEKCILAINYKHTGDTFYVYQCLNNPEVYYPTRKQVPDVEITNELWILKKVKVKLKYIIEITDPIEKPYRYTYGRGHYSDLYGYNYKIIKTF